MNTAIPRRLIRSRYTDERIERLIKCADHAYAYPDDDTVAARLKLALEAIAPEVK